MTSVRLQGATVLISANEVADRGQVAKDADSFNVDWWRGGVAASTQLTLL